ncbi:IucA/IucC family siderophore biosynthesis protein [Paenibacillus polysaccharolyticus]|uniref:IucA/IucC family protein n=1 Tax=Paenibacillus polysaccharolyticus TaxID=582692 RepID=UPI00203A9015|nr:IucA/IucC family protein [Paenibacillus polysaccharolyticus]MCM3134064.1 IucA/IucC family siderophore biosynthesis protein [Paenibacillus polysaccharolyticus]
MSTLMQRSSRQTAEQQVMSDLMNSLLAEQLLPLQGHRFVDFATAPAQLRQLYQGYAQWEKGSAKKHVHDIVDEQNKSGYNSNEYNFTLDNFSESNSTEDHASAQDMSVVTPPFSLGLHTEGVICLVENGVRQGIQWVQGSPIYQQYSDGSWTMLDTPAAVGRAVLKRALSEDEFKQPGVADFLASLDLAVEHYELGWNQVQTLSAYRPKSAYEWFVKSERIAALRDRPFHPSSKAKVGFRTEDVKTYAAEFGKEIRLRWVAIKRDAVQQGCEDGLSILDMLYDAQREEVQAECSRRGLSMDEYLPMPVHPWQLEHIILPRFTKEIVEGSVVVLDAQIGDVFATSSLRSMAQTAESALMLKLPVSVLSLGAARYLPVVKLLNGLVGEKMLRQAVACDETLKENVYMCEEQNWWGFMPESMGLFDDHPRHLAAQIRVYPAELLDDGYKIVPMAALGVNLDGHHLLTEIMGRNLSVEDVLEFYNQIATTFYDIVMRLFKVGVVPEIHGQNCCLVLEHNQVEGLLFRDHDSVRLHQPYLDKHGIADPGYHIRPGYSNSLYNETIQKLIFYVQSLGTQVNLASIMEAMSEVYNIPETKFWEITEQAWREALHEVQLPETDRSTLERVIFESEAWPVKLVVRPLLEADGVPGAMPSGKGQGWNPFYKA